MASASQLSLLFVCSLLRNDLVSRIECNGMVVQFHKITGIKVEKRKTGAYNAKGGREREREDIG